MTKLDEEIDNRYADWLLRNAIPNGECLECHLNPNAVKYPKVADNEMAHRFIHRTKKGPPGLLVVMHSCDNPRCINLEHLSLGTHKDNYEDCRNKGRASLEGRPRSLSEDDRIKIKEMRERKLTLQYIASEFGVSIGTVRNMLNGYPYANPI